MGSLYAAYLASAGVNVTIIERCTDQQDDLAAKHSLQKRKFSVSSELAAINRTFSVNASCGGERSEIKRLIVATKSYDALSAVYSVRHRLTQHSDVVLMSNGSGYQHDVAEAIPIPRYFCCLSTEGSNWRSKNSLQHAGSGRSRLGSKNSQPAPQWLHLWQSAIPGTQWEDDIESALWMKLIINAVINPITALAGTPNGALNTDAALSAKVTNLCVELSALTQASAHPQLASDLEREVRRVIAGTASNRSSMLQDIAAGRPTEIKFINGYISAEAKRLEIAVPLNDALASAIVALEDTATTRDAN